MGEPTDADSERRILATEVGADLRIEASIALARRDPHRAIRALLTAGENRSDNPETLRRIGAQLARTCHQIDHKPTEFDMRNLAGPAYEAYSDWMP